MSRVTYSMSMSLDGYINEADGTFDWSVPTAALFQMYVDELRQTKAHLLGRRLYETMLYWETADQEPEVDYSTREWAHLWKALPKTVFSTTLTSVIGNHTLRTSGIAEEIARLKAEPGDGDIAIGGAGLAAEVARLGLIDEYRISVHPVLVGGGTPYFAHDEQRVDLELVETRTFDTGVVYLRYRKRGA